MQERNNKICYICGPSGFDVERDTDYAKELTRLAVDAGYAPIAPCLYLTQILDERDPDQRETSVSISLSLLNQCQYILIGSKYGLTERMLKEIKAALKLGLSELAPGKQGLVVVYGKP